MREQFKTINFRAETLAVIEQANTIIASHQAQGFTLTLRQLYYQFVSQGLIANRQEEYKRLGTIVADARRAGLIDWSAIEDRTRFLRTLPTWNDPAEGIASMAEHYRQDVWATQPVHVEVWIEKDALLGVIERVCNEFRVPYFSCRGNVSDSEMYAAGRRFAPRVEQEQDSVILHLGDHDPSGLDMTRDITERVRMFARDDIGYISVRRLALNINQTAGLPPNPAKEEDSRYGSYVKKYGKHCWELDAMNPTTMVGLIRTALIKLIDATAWDAEMNDENANKALLTAASDSWDGIEDMLV